MKNIFIILSVLIAIAFGVYSVYQYKQSEQATHGFFVCDAAKTKCLLSQHLHAQLTLWVCGQQVDLPKQQGRLDHQHTHKEANLIHWHAQVAADPITQLPLEGSYLSVADFFTEIGYQFPPACPTNPTPQLQLLQTTWQDGDNVTVYYQ